MGIGGGVLLLDFKVASQKVAKTLLGVEDYPQVAQEALGKASEVFGKLSINIGRKDKVVPIFNH